MTNNDIINSIKMQYTRLTYKERLELRTWINGQYDFAVKDTSEEDPKINIPWRTDKDKPRFIVSPEARKRLEKLKRNTVEGPEGPVGVVGYHGVKGKIGVIGTLAD